MRYSKFININENILVEYIYDDNNLIGEPYNILYNSTTNTSCFVSTDQLVPPIKGYQQTNNELYNQLFIVSQDSYARVPSIGSNQISEVFPNLLVRNYPTSIPIRYDKIRVHIPVDYTFDPNKGFFLRVYTLDSTQRKFVELSNYHFDISDIEQQYKLEYSSNTFIYAEKQWGKYLEIQVPSITKISDQITDGLPTPNSINANLTDGLGLSRNAPIFIDFKDLTSISTLNGVKFVSTSTKKTIVLPQTPEFENLGVRIEESSQGDFFIIYPTYNGTQAEFVDYLDEQLVFGVKYQVKYIIDLFEEDVKSKSYTFNIYEDFGEELEFRPIFKFTNTTAIIDVSLRLVNMNDGSFVERKASFGLLQGGGQRMGSQANGRITSGNKSGGGGDICKYSSSLLKINLKKVTTTQVLNYRNIIQPAVGMESFGTRPILNLVRDPFVVFSTGFDVIDDGSSIQIE